MVPWDIDLLYEEFDRWGPDGVQNMATLEQFRKCLGHLPIGKRGRESFVRKGGNAISASNRIEEGFIAQCLQDGFILQRLLESLVIDDLRVSVRLHELLNGLVTELHVACVWLICPVTLRRSDCSGALVSTLVLTAEVVYASDDCYTGYGDSYSLIGHGNPLMCYVSAQFRAAIDGSTAVAL